MAAAAPISLKEALAVSGWWWGVGWRGEGERGERRTRRPACPFTRLCAAGAPPSLQRPVWEGCAGVGDAPSPGGRAGHHPECQAVGVAGRAGGGSAPAAARFGYAAPPIEKRARAPPPPPPSPWPSSSDRALSLPLLSHPQLPTLGIDPAFITFTNVTMESDKFICVRETGAQVREERSEGAVFFFCAWPFLQRRACLAGATRAPAPRQAMRHAVRLCVLVAVAP